ncbi:protein NipSnap homolog 3A [Cynoglossus semilaevis]|uniref:Nipsnap homolog 3A (C. elegans) n=1 Tax=Cynoglossus semilaevis TaxID=244447 RepID=A0A3P8UZP0_CYNSE|nr:protein NipSnap homolog 3B-like [Cynoglossus semilaevis]
MNRIRSFLLKSAAVNATAAAQPRVYISSGHQQQHQTFYELRTYCLHPHQTASFLKLTNEKIHLRTAHSQLIGYWSVEYGGLNQVFHIWKYDSYAQRAAVRAALAQDATWNSEYLSKASQMMMNQDNEVTYLVPWSNLKNAPQEGGVYELVTYQMHPGGPAVWGKAFQAALTARDAPGYGNLLGAFHSEVGLLNRVHALWWYASADQRAELRHKSHTDARIVAAVREGVAHLESQNNKLLFACPFSPMK